MKKYLFFLVVMFVVGFVQAQTTYWQGIQLNKNFVGPAQFVETASQGWMLLPNAGLSVSAEWEKTKTLTVGDTTTQSVVWSAGLCFEENFGQAANAKTVNNAVLGITGDWNSYNLVIGFQIMGPSLGGPGSNGLIVGASYPL